MAYEALESLQQTLLLVLQRDDHLITPPVKRRIISIHDKAVVLQFNLKWFPDKETMRELGKLAKELESTVGYVADYCNSDSLSVSSSSRSALKNEVEDLTVATELMIRLSIRLRRFTEKIKLSSRALVDDDLVVGFKNDVLQIKHRLNCNDRLRILPIVGMGGIGNLASILSQVLASIKDDVDRGGRDSFKGLEAAKVEIHKMLSGRRYLIVMDDMWSAEAWDHVRRLFPNNDNGSWIILTTRLMDVATYCTSLPVHMMRFLDDEQSWRLFNHKVFRDQDCPLELQNVGEKIVKGCGGLPLSIVNVAGLLSRIPRTPKL
ncbi:putative late blight resistance protein homolog R1A-3 [Salvia hispanica]|uniref:putative late blight resistance protein homolog R1A-3 n=1 Tax=Salvia hispanica TaxID=49212 RepID=UPI0020093AF8|nr:putative late blight resistance protein homolog R1A-3 [Salvia hispanica]